MPAPSVDEGLGREDALRPAPFRPAPSPLQLLRGRALFLGVLAAAGALLSTAAGALVPARYRATASLLVSEPRLSGLGAVDFNLTPVRSYTALAGSRALVEPCRAAMGPDAAVRVRIPEYTRIVELTADGAGPDAAAGFVNCVAQRVITENRRVNEEISARSVAPVGAALAAARTELQGAESRVAEARRQEGLEARRAALRAAVDAVDAGAEEERRALLAAEEAAARERSFASSGASVSSADRSTAAAEAAGARARVASASRARQEAARRVSALEGTVADGEQRLEVLRRSLAQAESVVNELVRRNATAPLDAAAKGFDLVLVSPAVPPARPSRPPLLVFAIAGAGTGLALGALLTLSRP